ncbi:MAG: adenylate/guanylate cyclase domain-containing protein [Alphaproteobacteria bacterium]|nr:adenylate/guanylate cyclase domain-containing protein [Alphaproteobacteria bacterium]
MKTPSQALVSISVTLATSIGIVVVVAVSAVLWIQWSTARLNTEELTNRLMGLIVTNVEDIIANELEPALHNIENLAARLESGEIDLADLGALELILTASMSANPHFRSFGFFDPAHQAYVARRVAPGPGGIVWELTDFGNDPAIVAAVDQGLASPAAFWGEPVFANEAVHVTRRQRIEIGGEPVGVLIASVTVSELSRLITEFGDAYQGTGFILFGRDHVLGHPTLLDLHPSQNEGHPLLTLPEIDDPVLQAFGSQRPNAELDGGFERYRLDVDGNEFVAFVRWIDAYGDVQWGAGAWRDSVEVDLARKRVANAGYIGLGALFISLIVAGLVGKTIARPIELVTVGAEKLGRLDLEQIAPLPPSRIRELDNQAKAMNTALDGLRAFGKYVPKQLVLDILSSDIPVEPGGDRRPITVLFTDIRGFTTISERMEPEALMQLLSIYFDQMVSEVLDVRGTVDKFVGDAIMAYWNAPLPQDNHELLGCDAALRCAALSDRLNAEWEAAGQEILYTRLGIHPGDCIVGNVGSDRRLDFTVFGSPVNLASRLEGLAEFYGVQILASEEIRQKCQDRFLFRPADLVLPKGVIEPVAIYELAGYLPGVAKAPDGLTVSQETITKFEKWQVVYDTYLFRDWQALITATSEYGDQYPEDPLAMIYAERAVLILGDPPGPDWNGVQAFASK